jgi:hypothetical protein
MNEYWGTAYGISFLLQEFQHLFDTRLLIIICHSNFLIPTSFYR